MRDRYDEHQKKRNVNRIEIATRYIIDIIPIAIIERAIILERKILYDTMSKKIFINSVEMTTFRIEINGLHNRVRDPYDEHGKKASDIFS